ncbi:MAG: CCA tRNA nucleotidyltransferase [Alphaproteobacteria bacterium]|nr:CCA tRNA nucleotidyltransferase [Alphaproteobacteria bacterium]
MFKPEYLDMSKIVQSAKVVRLFDAVEEHGGTVRFVGGAVRDTLAGLSGFDLDLATDLSPDELVEACQDNGLKTIPVGIKTATIGVVVDDKIVEVASLKRSTIMDNGRRIMEFTDDWSADASQRDLTINAVYADLRGNVFDYYDGITDLEKGIVRFIGNPEDRINEDPLRIMRFFRFYARFGKTPIDAESLAACVKLKDSLRTIAIERVRDELFKILITPNAAAAMKLIYDNDILAYFLPKSRRLDALERLSKLVEDMRFEGNFLRRLFVLYQPTPAKAENMANTLRFTKKQKEIFVRWAKIDVKPEYLNTPKPRLQFIYRYGKQFCLDKVLLGAAIYGYKNINVGAVLQQIENAVMPIFPVRGRDVVNAGISGDQKIGKIMDRLERQWIDSDFKMTREELLHSIQNQ